MVDVVERVGPAVVSLEVRPRTRRRRVGVVGQGSGMVISARTRPVERRLGRSSGLLRPSSAAVVEVVADGRAAKAGLGVGDRIVGLDEHTIASVDDLQDYWRCLVALV